MRLFAYLLTLFSLVSFTFYAQSYYVNQRTIAANTDSTVFIYAEDPSGQMVMTASGAIINNHYILSANHVVDSAGEIGTPVKFFARYKDGQKTEIEPSVHLFESDLGVFTFTDIENVKPAELMCKTPAVGTPVYTVGNPHGYEWLTTMGTVAGTDPLKNGRGGDEPEKFKEFSKHGVVVNMAIYPGNSGGGLYDMASGALIGVMSRVLGYPAKVAGPEGMPPLVAVPYMDIGQATNSESVCKFLDDHSIAYKKIGFYL